MVTAGADGGEVPGLAILGLIGTTQRRGIGLMRAELIAALECGLLNLSEAGSPSSCHCCSDSHDACRSSSTTTAQCAQRRRRSPTS